MYIKCDQVKKEVRKYLANTGCYMAVCLVHENYDNTGACIQHNKDFISIIMAHLHKKTV